MITVKGSVDTEDAPDEFEQLVTLVSSVRRICLSAGCEVATEVHDDPPRATIALVAKGASS